MSVASECLADLDEALAETGEVVGLHLADADDNPVVLDVRAFVRGYKPDELSGGVQQGETTVILSPTGLAAFPVRLGGITIGGRDRIIEVADLVRVGGAVVRIALVVSG